VVDSTVGMLSFLHDVSTVIKINADVIPIL